MDQLCDDLHPDYNFEELRIGVGRKAWLEVAVVPGTGTVLYERRQQMYLNGASIGNHAWDAVCP